MTATARKIAVLFYNAVRHGMECDPGASSYETRYRTRVVNNLHLGVPRHSGLFSSP